MKTTKDNNNENNQPISFLTQEDMNIMTALLPFLDKDINSDIRELAEHHVYILLKNSLGNTVEAHQDYCLTQQ